MHYIIRRFIEEIAITFLVANLQNSSIKSAPHTLLTKGVNPSNKRAKKVPYYLVHKASGIGNVRISLIYPWNNNIFNVNDETRFLFMFNPFFHFLQHFRHLNKIYPHSQDIDLITHLPLPSRYTFHFLYFSTGISFGDLRSIF